MNNSESKGFNVELTASLQVVFEDESKVKAFFFDSVWSRCFCEFNDLTDLAENIALDFDGSADQFNKKTINGEVDFRFFRQLEGFNDFIQSARSSAYISENDEYGRIIVYYDCPLEQGISTEMEKADITRLTEQKL